MTQTSLLLEAGDALTVTADANSSGSVRRLEDVAGSGVQYSAATISASSSTVVGPFSAPRRYLLTSETGQLTYAVGTAEPTSSSAGLAAALPDETGTGKAVFNDSPVVETFLEIGVAESAPSASSTGVRLYVIEVDGLKVLKARFAGGHATIATDPD